MKSGDVILSTAQEVSSIIVRTGTRSAWSHVALVIWINKKKQVELEGGPGRTLCLFEVGNHDSVNQLTEKVSCHPRLIRICDSLLTEYRTASVVRLKPIVKRDAIFLSRLRQFVAKYCTEKLVFAGGQPVIDWFFNKPLSYHDDGRIYCTELIGYYLKEVLWDPLKLPKEEFPKDMITPKTFTDLPLLFEKPYVFYNQNVMTAEDKTWISLLLLALVVIIVIYIFLEVRAGKR